MSKKQYLFFVKCRIKSKIFQTKTRNLRWFFSKNWTKLDFIQIFRRRVYSVMASTNFKFFELFNDFLQLNLRNLRSSNWSKIELSKFKVIQSKQAPFLPFFVEKNYEYWITSHICSFCQRIIFWENQTMSWKMILIDIMSNWIRFYVYLRSHRSTIMNYK